MESTIFGLCRASHCAHDVVVEIGLSQGTSLEPLCVLANFLVSVTGSFFSTSVPYDGQRRNLGIREVAQKRRVTIKGI